MGAVAAAPAEAAYARLCLLLSRLQNAGPAERTALAALALRAALHPALGPWRADPLRPLAGEYVSLDAHVEVLASLVPRGAPMSPEDVAAVAPWRRPVEGRGGPAAVGVIGGALWVPQRAAAVPCAVRAALVPGRGGEPEPVREVSPAVAASASAAWECALAAASRDTGSYAVIYDACSADLSDEPLAAVGGDSLGLPLALAFLSALLAAPIPPGVAATGGVAADGRVLPVGRVAEKARASRTGADSGLFLAPAGESAPGVLSVSTLADAAAALGLAPKAARRPVSQNHPALLFLPDPATPFFGRGGEVSLLAATLRAGARRLVTLLGPGGVGKTRLALRVAAEAAPHFPDGVVFVPLEAAAPDDVPSAVAGALREALGIAAGPGADLARAVGGRRLLLVLDNFEGALPGGADAVSALLSGASGLACLVTSRAPLLLRVEQRHEVEPLPDAPAAELLRDRARAVRPDFDAAPAEVAALCHRLDGLPLALELAAARLADRTLPELSAELDAALIPALASEWRDLPPRQRTLAATLEWSYSLLSGPQRRAFRALSVFAGGFTDEDARAVEPGADPDSLSCQSLLRAAPGGAYRMLPLLREFAAARLAAAGEEVAARDRHAAHLLAVARRHGAAYGTANEVAAFDALAARWDDLKAAWGHLITSRPEDAPAFAAAVCDFLRRRGHAAERGAWPRIALGLIVEGRADAPLAVRARLHVAVGLALKDAGDDTGAERQGGEALSLADGAANVAGEALNLLGLVAARGGRMDEARRRLEDARARFAGAGSPRGEAMALNNLGKIARDSADWDTARRHHEAALALARAHGDLHARAYALNGLGNALSDTGDRDAARAVFSEYLEVARQLGDYAAAGTALFNLSATRFECAGGPGADAERRDALTGLVAAEAVLSRIGHRSAAHVTTVLEGRAGPKFATTLFRLRSEFARRPLAELLGLGDL